MEDKMGVDTYHNVYTDKLKSGIMNSSILTTKLNLFLMFYAEEPFKSAEWKFYKKKNYESWAIVSKNFDFTNVNKTKRYKKCMMKKHKSKRKMYI